MHGLADLCQSAVPSVYSISPDNHHITFNGVQLPLYNQKVVGKDNLYFFHEVETRFIENDNEIQLLHPLGRRGRARQLIQAVAADHVEHLDVGEVAAALALWRRGNLLSR